MEYENRNNEATKLLNKRMKALEAVILRARVTPSFRGGSCKLEQSRYRQIKQDGSLVLGIESYAFKSFDRKRMTDSL